MRISTGVLAIAMLLAGGVMYFTQPDVNQVVVGMLIRIGLLLGVIWLAFPDLETFKGRVPMILIGLIVLCLAVMAARPNIGKVLFTIVTIGVSVGGVMKWLSNLTKGGPPRQYKRD